MAGAVLLIKYNLLAFYAVWIMAIFIILFKNTGFRQAIRAVLLFALGGIIMTAPFVIYFAANRAVESFITVYFLNNFNKYPVAEASFLTNAATVLKNCMDEIKGNAIYTVFVFAGLVYMCVSKVFSKAQKAGLVCSFIVLMGAVFAGGRHYAYYILIFWSYIPFAFILLQKIIKSFCIGKMRIAVPITAFLGGIAIIFSFCSNIYFFRTERESYPQFKFAEIMNKSEDPTLLNYNFMDGGFYTASGIVPNVKYFSMLNILSDDILKEQNNYLINREVEFVVTADRPLDDFFSDKYELVTKEVFNSKSYSTEYYLYRRQL
jgi:hypothetical protein